MNLLSVLDLKVYFQTEQKTVKAIDGISFELKKGDSLGIVGESGSGKSTLSLSILRLIPSNLGKIVGGQIKFKGQDLLSISNNEIRKIRGKQISVIFQDPMISLNPFLRISTQLMEGMQLHLALTKKEAYTKSLEMLRSVEIEDAVRCMASYPHELSGGLRQRVLIAMAMSCSPELLIADEPTTALDVITQAKIIQFINNARAKFGMSLIFITHDLGVVSQVTDYVAVMYAGKIVEYARTKELFEKPFHPYTQSLFKAIPNLAINVENLPKVSNAQPNLTNFSTGCYFAHRCTHAMSHCFEKYPPTHQINEKHEVDCWLYSS